MAGPPRTPNWRWIEGTWKHIVVPILDTLDKSSREQVEADLETIRSDPDGHPFPAARYRGRDLPGGRTAVVGDGRFLLLFIKYADHPVLAVRNFLDSERFDENEPGDEITDRVS